jgi:hypothetical protein
MPPSSSPAPVAPSAPATPPSGSPTSPSLPTTTGAIISGGADLGSSGSHKAGAPELFLPGNQVGTAGPEMMVDLGSFMAFHSPSTTWTVTVDWGDGTFNQGTTSVTGGLGSWAHTYARPGLYQVTVSVQDGSFQSGTHDFDVRAA